MFRPCLILCASLVFTSNTFAQLPKKVIDLKNTPTATKIINAVDRILPGNRSSVSLDSFVADLGRLEIRAKINIRAGHSWGTISVPNGFGIGGISYRDVDMAADRRAYGSFTYNLRSNQIRGTVEIPLGRIGFSGYGQDLSADLGTLRLSLDEIEQIIDGDWDVLLQKIPNFGTITREHENEYRHIRESYEKRFGKKNVYFASPEFVRWASSERLGKWVAVGVVTGGSNLKGVMKQVQKKAIEELGKIQDWLQDRGLRAAKETALAMIRGEQVSFPYMALKWQSVRYASRVKVFDQPISPWIPVRHGAFAIIWTQGTGNVVKDDRIGTKTVRPEEKKSNFRIAVGRTTSGKLSRSDGPGKYHDNYLIQLKAGKSYVVDLKGDYDTYLRLYRGTTKVAENDDHNGNTRHSQIIYKPTVDDAYRIMVTSFGSGVTGSYKLATAVQSGAGSSTAGSKKKRVGVTSISIGGSRSGSLTSSDPLSGKQKRFDVYVAELSAGRTYTFDLKGDYDTYLHLYSDGKRLASNDDYNNSTRHSRITYRATDTDKYFLIVTSFGEKQTGSYTLTASAGSSNSTTKPATPTTIGIGTTRSGSLTSSDAKSSKDKYYDEYRVSLSAGRTYTFDMVGSFDTYLRLYSGVKQVAENDDYKTTNHSRIVYKAASSGTYRLIATSYGKNATGTYKLTTGASSSSSGNSGTKPKNNATVTSISVGSSRSGSLSTSDALSSKSKYYDVYTANLIGGRKYVVDLVSQEYDTYLFVYRGRKELGSNDDHNGSRSHSRVTFQAPGSGEYRFIVTSFKERATGRYGLALGELKTTTVRPKPQPKAVDGRVEKRGVLAKGDYTNKDKYYDVHTFTFQAGRTYTIELTSSAFDAYLVLQDSNRKILARNDDAFGTHSRVVYRPTRTATYRVIATSLRTGRTGAYNVFLRSSSGVSR